MVMGVPNFWLRRLASSRALCAESVASNWVFDPVITRMISVDQRYMRWIMQEVMPAPQLLKELGVAPKK